MTNQKNPSPLFSCDTKVRCSAIMHRKLHRDDPSRFKTFHPRNAIDGNSDTYWAGGYNGSQECWIEIILPEEHIVTHMDVKFRYAAEIALQALIDGIWVTVKMMKAPTCPKDQTIDVSISTFIRPTKQIRLVETKRHPEEIFDTKENYNLYNCGMEVGDLNMKGYPASGISFNPDEPPAVFFSCNCSHQEFVAELAFEIENSLRVKMRHDSGQIRGGDSLLMAKQESIREAKALVCCMSQDYAKSINCQQEIFMAIELRVPVVLLLLDDVSIDHLQVVNPFLAHAFVKHTHPIKVSRLDEEIIKLITENLDHILNYGQVCVHNALPLAQAVVPTHAVVKINDISNKQRAKVVAKSHKDSVIQLKRTSERHDLALGRPCNSSGNFYSLPEEWISLHDSCVTVELREGMKDRHASGRWSGAKDGEGLCWISVDLGCLALVDEVVIDQEAAYAVQYTVRYEKGELVNVQGDGTIGGEWVTIGNYSGGEGICTTKKFNPVSTRSICIELSEPRWTGAGFSLWSLEVFGTSRQKPIYSYFFSTTSHDLQTWSKYKIIKDVESRMRKKAYKHIGNEALPNNYMHGDPLSSREEAIKQCEVVIVMYSKQSALNVQDNHVISDTSDALNLKKPIIPIILDCLTFQEGNEDKLIWPPTEPTLRSAFEQLIFVDFSDPDQYLFSMRLLIRTLCG